MTGSILRIERAFDAPREAVFDAWTSPEVLRRWWAAGTGWSTPVADVDLRVGGRYRLSMRDPAAAGAYTVVGEYVEVVRPERLVYTWTWEGEPAEQAGSEGTLVSVDFLETGGRTTVVITHTGFAGPGVAAQHEHGWNACLENLGATLAPVREAG
ncbi:MAG TPA: SRPBCC domain-containing protein [Solirubrobacteraceae bacterium]|nr:SRPBCC domain-containing protein [Solirubrobacteraceae bacterium]